MKRNTILLGGWLGLTTAVAVVSSCGDDATQPGPSVTTTTGGGGSGGGGGAGGVAEGIISTSSASEYETDPEIIVAGSGSDATVAIAWTGFAPSGKSHIGYAVSQNGGATWSEPATIESPDDASYLAPDLVADSFGNIRMVFVAFHGSGLGADIYSATASSSGTFSAPTPITDVDAIGYYDRPKITITNAGTLVVTYNEIVDGSAQIGLATSADGDDWTIAPVTSGGESHLYPYPCADRQTADGRLFVVSLRGDQVEVRYSDDSGETWEGGGQINGTGASHAPACSTRDGELWVSYGVAKQKALGSVRVVHLLEDLTVDQEAVVSDPEAGSLFYNHDISVEQDLAVNVVYYAGAGVGDEVATFRHVRYTEDDLPDPMDPPDPDAGPPGLPSEIVHQPITFNPNSKSEAWLGNNVGMLWRDGSVYIAYVDNASRDAHVSFRKIAAE